ncbi:MAG: aromatic hydrocarbon degradation protein, partial [Chitinophagaceae bacterium]|nr:aromatic hydrocarbon degradation protein [Chitinophagaceae bacterium]
APFQSGIIQENEIKSAGSQSELAIAVAGTGNEKILYGLTLGIPFVNYKRTSTFTEADASTALNNFNYAAIEEYLETSGSGVNLKLGIIYRPAPQWRIGFSFHSPTFLKLTDKYSATVTTDTENYKGLLTQSSKEFTNGDLAQYSYLHFTPSRMLASISYVLREIEDVTKQKGFLTGDVEFVNYRASSFKVDPASSDQTETKAYYSKLNDVIDEIYRPAVNVRLGGELKFTTIMTRLGMAYLGNPYQNSNGEKGSRLQLTGGLGYRNQGYFIDLAYVHTTGKDIHSPYRLSQQPFPSAQISQRGARVVLTLGVKF